MAPISNCLSSQVSSAAGSSAVTAAASGFPSDWDCPSEADLHQINELYQKKKKEFSDSFFFQRVNNKRYILASYTDKATSKDVGFIFFKELHNSKYAVVCAAMNLINREIVVLKLIREAGLGKKELEVYERLDSLEDTRTYCVTGPRFKCKDIIGLILPYFGQGDLLEYHNNVLSEDLALAKKKFPLLLFQMASALAFLHENGMVHLDVKPENYLVDCHGNVFLADFGLSSFIGDDLNEAKGSPGYVDPFFFKEPKPKSFTYNPASDCWSLGVSSSVLTHGPGFRDWTKQMGKQPDWRYLGNMPEEDFEDWKSQFSFDPLTDQLLQLNPEKRITARKVADEMSKRINSNKKLKA